MILSMGQLLGSFYVVEVKNMGGGSDIYDFRLFFETPVFCQTKFRSLKFGNKYTVQVQRKTGMGTMF